MTDTIAPVLGEATIQELRTAVEGQIFTPGDDSYTEAASVWNGAHDHHRPAVVVRCAGAADVSAAVGFARSTGLTIAVRGGGHSVAGFSTCDDGMVIDLSAMTSVRVDPVAMRATVGGGAVWADVDHETQAHGLATTGGLISTTGVAGFTLGGGIGWIMRKYGLACDNLAAPTSSPRTAGSSTRARPRTPTSSGACAAAAATSASSRSSSSTCTRSARPSTPGRSSTPPTPPATSCAYSATGRRARPTTSPRSST